MMAPPPPRTSRRRARLLPLAALLLLLLLLGGPAVAEASPIVISDLGAAPAKILAESGRSTITVRATDVRAGGEPVTLSTTLGAFGAPGGPTRVVLAMTPNALGEAQASAALFGEGRSGDARVTARASGGAIERSVTVTFTGLPSSLTFQSPNSGSLLSAAVPQALTVQARDGRSITVPGAAVTLQISAGTLAGAGQRGRSITVLTDGNGRARASLQADPGVVHVSARAAAAAAELRLTLHGPPASLRLISLRSAINLGDHPFAAPAGSLFAIVQDAGGRPVPDVPVRFDTDLAGVRVVTEAHSEDATDAGGSLRARLSAATAEEPGTATVTARAGDLADNLADSITIRVVGPPAKILLRLGAISGGDYTLAAVVQDGDGFAVPTGFELDWELIGLGGDGPGFEPARSLVRDGEAATVLHLGGADPAGLVVRATLAGSDPPLAGSAFRLGTPLTAGLNHLIWKGRTGVISEVVDPIRHVVISAWRLDRGAGWQGYFPVAGLGENYFIAHGDEVYLFLAAPVLLPDVELAP